MRISPAEQLQAQAASTEALTPLRQTGSAYKVATEFEALFLAQLLKVMRESVASSGLLEASGSSQIYSQMLDQEVGRALAESGGLGLAPLIARELQERLHQTTTSLETKPRRVPERRTVVPPAERHLSSSYGWRRDPITGETRFHAGIDVRAPEGTPVHSPGKGRIVFSGRQPGYGKTVVVELEEGFQVRYAHLSQIEVQRGQHIGPRERVGKVGKTGRATGPHLHLELVKDGRHLNPLSFSAVREIIAFSVSPDKVSAASADKDTSPIEKMENES